jgi:hypothetical protein
MQEPCIWTKTALESASSQRIQNLIEEEKFYRNMMKKVHKDMDGQRNWQQNMRDECMRIEMVGGKITGISPNQLTWKIWNEDGQWDTITELVDENGRIIKNQ